MNFAKHTILPFFAAVLLASCGSQKDVPYFQNSAEVDLSTSQYLYDARFLPKDQLTITVSCIDDAAAAPFNMTVPTPYSVNSRSTYSQPMLQSYLVDNEGNIDFPQLGKIRVTGMQRQEIAALIKSKLIETQLVLDPVVTVEFANLFFSVLGEVSRPGRYNIDQDKISILDAISMAGDLNINGKRKNVTVFRENNGKKDIYSLDLTSAYNLYSSPAYYLQQKDIVYVEPNDNRIRQSTINGNNVRSTSFWISLTSLLTSITVLIVNLTK